MRTGDNEACIENYIAPLKVVASLHPFLPPCAAVLPLGGRGGGRAAQAHQAGRQRGHHPQGWGGQVPLQVGVERTRGGPLGATPPVITLPLARAEHPRLEQLRPALGCPSLSLPPFAPPQASKHLQGRRRAPPPPHLPFSLPTSGMAAASPAGATVSAPSSCPRTGRRSR